MLKRYLERLYDTIISRGDVEVELLVVDDQAGQRGAIEGKLRFYDGPRLEFDEAVLLRGTDIIKLRYAYHYQSEAGDLIFRYDNAPHYPNLPTHPHHKHIRSDVTAVEAPDLSEVLREIEQHIYSAD